MAYEHKENKGSVFPVDDRSGTMILSGKLNINEWKRREDDTYPPKSVVVKEPEGRLTLYVQVATLFKDEDKDWAYSGSCGEEKVFAYANQTKNGQKFLNLSVTSGGAKYSKPEAPQAEQSEEQQVAVDDIPF
jgi:hypothetical protein